MTKPDELTEGSAQTVICVAGRPFFTEGNEYIVIHVAYGPGNDLTTVRGDDGQLTGFVGKAFESVPQNGDVLAIGEKPHA